MELIQNSLYNREGKKWKRRWACLKRVSPNSVDASNEETYLIVFLYKSQDHVVEGKEKYVIPLMDFCGLECRKQYDRSNDVLITITASQTAFFSFGERSCRDKWVRILEDQFGKALSYNINIPDKQKKKNAESTIRIYRNFFSITNNNYKCLNRWFTNDIRSFSVNGDSQFMFEMGPQNKSKGLLVNIVTSEAEELLRAFETITAEHDDQDSGLVQRDFTGSSILIDLEQSKRNAGDRNFLRRAILRASDRLRKKHRDRTRSAPTARKHFRPSKSMNDSMSDETRFCSLDRKKSPDIGVSLNDESREKTIRLLRSVSSPNSPVKKGNFSKQISIDDAPPVPKKKSPTASSSSQPIMLEQKDFSRGNERNLLKPRSMTIGDIPVPKDIEASSKDQTTKSEEKLPSEGVNVKMKQKAEPQTPDEATKKIKLTMSPTDKSEIIKQNPRRSTDNITNNNYKQPANPAHYALAKTKRKIDKKTPTPPPRSPVSLGLAPQTTVFDFPPTDQVEDSIDGEEQELPKPTQPDASIKRRTFHSSGSDDAFASCNASPSVFDYSNLDSPGEPAYGNISHHMRKDSSDDNSSQIVAAHNARRLGNSSKNPSDPLSLEQWSLATGEGQQITSLNNLQDQDQDRLDYINVKSNIKNEDSPHGSYVNVSTSESGQPEIGGRPKKGRKNIPAPLKLKPAAKSYKNDFEKYDDDDSSIYQIVGLLDSDAGSRGSASSISRRAGGSYENLAGKPGATSNVNHKSDYLNLMSPLSTKSKSIITSKSMNYAVLPDAHLFSKSVSTSPIRGTARSPIEKSNTSDYTLIDEIGTDALNRAKNSREKQLFSTGNKTPTKALK